MWMWRYHTDSNEDVEDDEHKTMIDDGDNLSISMMNIDLVDNENESYNP